MWKKFSGILGKELRLFYGNHEYNLKHFGKNLEMDEKFYYIFMEISPKLEKFQKILLKKILRTFCRKFLKICGNIFGSIWNYFTNISRKFSNFLLGGRIRGNVKKCWEFLEHFKDNFLGKLNKNLVHVVEEISKTSIFWKKFEDGSRTRKRIL